MAGKVNTKFVFILIAVLALLVGGVAIFYMTVVRKSASELEAMGNSSMIKAAAVEIDPTAESQALAEAYQQRGQQYRQAAQFYGRAWNRDNSNVDMLIKYLDAYSQMTVADPLEAQNVLKSVYSLTRQSTELRDDDAQLERFYEMLLRWGQQLGSTGFYRDLETISATRLETDPDNVVALKYNAISRAMRLSDDMDRGQQQQIREVLERVLETRPGDTDVLHYLGRWHLYDAARSQQVEPQAPATQAAREQVKTLADRSLQAAPDDPRVKLEYLDLMLGLHELYRRAADPRQTDETTATKMQEQADTIMAEARPVLEKLEADLRENPDNALSVQRIAEMLPRIDRTPLPDNPTVTRGLQRTENLLRDAAQKRPDILLYRLMLANILKLQLQLDEALEQFRLARDLNVAGDFLATLRDDTLRQQAVYEVANIELIRAEAAEDPEVREKILVDAETAVDRLEDVTQTDSRVLMLRGKIAMLRGQNTRAMQAIDKAAGMMEATGNASSLIEAYLLSARARQEEKQWGAAAERLEQVLQVVQTSPRQDIRTNIRLQLAEMLIRSRRFDAARDQLEVVLSEEPNSATAAQLLATWYADQGQPDQAIEIIEQTGLAESSQVVARRLASYYQAAGRNDQGRELLMAQIDKNPADIGLIQQALNLIDDPAEKVALLDRAAAAGASAQIVDVLRQQITGNDTDSPTATLTEMLDRTTSASATPLDVALRNAQVYLQFGQIDEARAAFEEARRLAPEDDRVLLLSLDLAMLDQRFEEARRLVAEAGKRNLDLADGHFLRGKLALAEGQIRQAIASYEQGLDLRPIFDEGWRQLGEIHLRNNDPDAAVNALTTSLNQRPDNVQTLVALAGAYDALGQRSQALEALSSASRYAPNNQGVVGRYLDYEARYGNPDKVVAARREMAASDPQNLNNRLALAGLLSQDDQHREAMDVLDGIESDAEVELSEDGRRNLLTVRAAIHRDAGDDELGRQLLEGYLDQRGSDADSRDQLLLARYQVGSGQVNEALASYRRAMELEDPAADRPAAREYADVLFNFNQIAQAVELYQQLFAQVKDPAARQRLGLRLAEAQLRLDQPDAAEAVLGQLDPGATAEALRGMIAAQRGNPQQALDYINASLGRDDQNALTYLQRAVLLARSPETLNQALADAEQALSLNPELVQAMTLRAQLLLQMDRGAEAIRGLRQLLEVAPGNNAARLQLVQLLLQTQRPDEAAEMIDRGLELEPENPTWLMAQANLATSRGQTARAVAALEQVMQVNPGAQALGQLALLYLDDDRATAAAALLDEHPTLLNQSAALQAVRGRALAAAGQSEPAERVFTLALQRSASPTEVGQVLRQMFEALGAEAAVALAEQVQHPSNPQWIDLSLAAISLSDRDYDAAGARLLKLREMSSNADDATRIQIEKMQAMVMLQTGDNQAAAAAYRRLLEVEPNNLEVLNNLAYILANDLGDPQSAIPLAERARGLAPGNAEILDTLGWTYYQANRMDDARRVLEESVQARALPANTYHLGRLYYERSNEELARTLLTQSLQLAQEAQDQAMIDMAGELLRKIGG